MLRTRDLRVRDFAEHAPDRSRAVDMRGDYHDAPG